MEMKTKEKKLLSWNSGHTYLKNGDPAKYSGGRNHYAKMTFCKQDYLLVHLH